MPLVANIIVALIACFGVAAVVLGGQGHGLPPDDEQAYTAGGAGGRYPGPRVL